MIQTYSVIFLQISWAKDHKVATTGTIIVRVFDNEGYNAYRKVIICCKCHVIVEVVFVLVLVPFLFNYIAYKKVTKFNLRRCCGGS